VGVFALKSRNAHHPAYCFTFAYVYDKLILFREYAPSGLMRSGQFLSLVLLCCFTYINFNGCLWDASTCAANLAANGHLEGLQWAHSNGCEFNNITCENAATNGNLEMLRWLLQEVGCSWRPRECYMCARIHQKYHVARWIKQHRDSFNVEDERERIISDEESEDEDGEGDD
jgi:hypothetical protein